VKKQLRIVIIGTLANVPYAGMAWMHCQFLVGLARLGHQVTYMEMTSAWPFHPSKFTVTSDPEYSLSYLQRVMQDFGFAERWAYCTTWSNKEWYGPLRTQALEILHSADAVLNISGSTNPKDIGIDCNLVHIGTDPVVPELRIFNGDEELEDQLRAHKALFTYGENIGRPDCLVPPLPFPTYPMRQPIVLDYWNSGSPARKCFTTVTNWEVTGYDFPYKGEYYRWSKHHEYLKFISLPQLAKGKFELAMGLSGVSEGVKNLLNLNGWNLVDGYEISLNPWPYRDYILNSAAEFTVAKDMNVRLQSGWFSERSACYLAAGRPVITQDTGFGHILPIGEGLFAFKTMDDILKAVDAINFDYERHSLAAREIAEEYFRAEKVLGQVLEHLGL
jgi:hypothetical protein